MAWAIKLAGGSQHITLPAELNLVWNYNVKIVYQADNTGSSFGLMAKVYGASTDHLRIGGSGEIRFRTNGPDRVVIVPSLLNADEHIIEIEQRQTGIDSYIKVDGVSVLTYTDGGNTTFDIGVLGTYWTTPLPLIGYIKEVQLTQYDTTDKDRNYSPDASDHSNTGLQPVLTDISVNAVDAAGVNMPTDGSAWLDLGGGAIASTGDITVPVPAFSVSASSTLPSYESSIGVAIATPLFGVDSSVTLPEASSNIQLDILKPVFSVGLIVTLPDINSVLHFNIDKPTFSAISSVSLPSPASSVQVEIQKPIFKALSNVTSPSYQLFVDVNFSPPVFNVDSSVTLPNPTSNLSIQTGKPLFSIFTEVTDASTTAQININVDAPSFGVSGGITLPSPTSSVQSIIEKPVFSLSASISGIEIVVTDNAKITLDFKNNKIIHTSKSNKLII